MLLPAIICFITLVGLVLAFVSKKNKSTYFLGALLIPAVATVVSFYKDVREPQLKGASEVEDQLRSLPKHVLVRFRVRNECDPCKKWQNEQIRQLQKSGIKTFPSPVLIGSEIEPGSGVELKREGDTQVLVTIG
jgi:hypothetical protein